MKTLIVIGGATATGKTAVALDLAKHFHTKILSADSRQCYRELNIGVAKPTNSQLQEVAHFFVNSHSIHEEVSAGSYEKYGLNALESIFAESDFAICVGGTGLYIKALCEGMDEMPAVKSAIEQLVNAQYKEYGLEWLQNEIKLHDANFLVQGELKNPSRILRALIFKLSTGESILNFRKAASKQRNFNIKYVALSRPRELLYMRIGERVDEMLHAGLLDEALLLNEYKHLKALQTVGYTELFDYFAGLYPLSNAIEKVKQHTRNYAKRQITWFKNQSSYLHLPPDYENIIAALKT